MGIPRMFGHIQSLAIPRTLGCQTNDCDEHPTRQNISIDGPSLAFYINYRILAYRSPSTSPVDAVPSYSELGNATIIFLDELRRQGALMYDDVEFHCPESAV